MYGNNIVVNLVNQRGHEKPLKAAFGELMGRLGMDRVKYVYFDFNHECNNIRWDRLSLLTDMLKDDIAKQQYPLCNLQVTVDIPLSRETDF